MRNLAVLQTEHSDHRHRNQLATSSAQGSPAQGEHMPHPLPLTHLYHLPQRFVQTPTWSCGFLGGRDDFGVLEGFFWRCFEGLGDFRNMEDSLGLGCF